MCQPHKAAQLVGNGNSQRVTGKFHNRLLSYIGVIYADDVTGGGIKQ